MLALASDFAPLAVPVAPPAFPAALPVLPEGEADAVADEDVAFEVLARPGGGAAWPEDAGPPELEPFAPEPPLPELPFEALSLCADPAPVRADFGPVCVGLVPACRAGELELPDAAPDWAPDVFAVGAPEPALEVPEPFVP